MHLVWICKCCGKQYDSLSFAYALDLPDPWLAIPEHERRLRSTLTTDRCIIDQTQFLIRARVEIPVHDRAETFIWGIWASVSREDYGRIAALWNTEIREHEPPIPGTLCSDISIYPRTTGLACTLHLRNAGRRPSIKLAPADHPLAVEQRGGITLERVQEIAAAMGRHRHYDPVVFTVRPPG
jgi:hypothetical protein